MDTKQISWTNKCIKHGIEPLKFETYKYETDKKEFIIHFFEIHEITPSLRDYIDSKICRIVEGRLSKTKLKYIKENILLFIEKKCKKQKIHNSTTAMGAITEFFIHLFLSLQDYQQECLFSNLEENSIKKGFDGIYSKDEEIWIMESKSGLSTTKGISHHTKLKEAYADLKEKTSGQTSNNPWKNALHHSIVAGSKKDIVESIQQLLSNTYEKRFNPIEEHNIIPSATIIFNNNLITFDKETIAEEIMEDIHSFKAKQIHFICATKKTLNCFVDYLKS